MRFIKLFFALLILFISFSSYAKTENSLDIVNKEIAYLNYNKSAKLAKQIRSKSKIGSDEWLKSTLALAVSLHQRQPDVKAEKARAAKLYDELIEASPGKPVQVKAMLLRARLADQIDYLNDAPDKAKARELYDKIIKEWPSSKLVHAAALHKAQLDIFSNDENKLLQGMEFTKDWLKKYPTNLFASLQWQLLGTAYYRNLDEPLKAMETYLKAEAVGLPPLTQLDSYYWLVAGLADKGGNTNVAVKYFKKIITDIKSSGFAFESQIRLKELGVKPPELVDPFAEAVK